MAEFLRPLKTQIHLGLEALKKVTLNLGHTIIGGAYDADWGVTWARLWQVFSNVRANSENDVHSLDAEHHPLDQACDGSNPQGHHNQTVYGPTGSPDAGLTTTGWSIVGLTFVAFGIGIWREMYRKFRREELQSYDHVEKSVRAVDPNIPQEKTTTDAMADYFDRQLSKSGEGYEIDRSKTTQIKLQLNEEQAAKLAAARRKKERELLDSIEDSDHLLLQRSEEELLLKANSQALESSKSLFPLSPEEKKQFKPYQWADATNALTGSWVGTWTKKTWDFLFLNSVVFWIAWYPLMVVFGLVAINTLPALALYSLTAPLLYTAALAGTTLVDWLFKSKTPSIPNHESKVRDLATRFFIKNESHCNRDKLSKAALAMNMSDSEWSEWKLQRKSFAGKANPGYRGKNKVANVLNSKLGRNLQGGYLERKGRFAAPVFNDALNAYISGVFILWLLSTVVLASIAVPAIPAALGGAILLTGISNLIGGGVAAAIGGTIAGVFCGAKAIANAHTQELKYKETIYEKLTEEYTIRDKATNDRIPTGITMLERFEYLENEVTERKAHIEKLRRVIRNKGLDKTLSDDEKIIMKYNLKEIDPYNDYYFEKLKHSPSAWTYVKKGGNRVYEALGGGQTGVFFVRTLALAGGVAATLVAGFAVGGPVGFMIGCGILAGLAGTARYAQYEFDHRKQHKVDFVEKLPTRLSYLKKANKELEQMEYLLEQKAEGAAVPTSLHKVPSVPVPEVQNTLPKKRKGFELFGKPVERKSVQLPNNTFGPKPTGPTQTRLQTRHWSLSQVPKNHRPGSLPPEEGYKLQTLGQAGLRRRGSSING